MDTNELRIGNWVLYPHTQLEPFRIEYPRHIELAGIVQPIPLTPEILEAAGFEHNPKSELWINWVICFDKNLQCFISIGREEQDIEINYLHQLQNLYFSLTGTELKVSLTEKVNV
jgi:hypothetical protein